MTPYYAMSAATLASATATSAASYRVAVTLELKCTEKQRSGSCSVELRSFEFARGPVAAGPDNIVRGRSRSRSRTTSAHSTNARRPIKSETYVFRCGAGRL